MRDGDVVTVEALWNLVLSLGFLDSEGVLLLPQGLEACRFTVYVSASASSRRLSPPAMSRA